MQNLDKIIIEIELHSVEGMRQCFENGVDPNTLFRDKPLIYELIGEYTRSPGFKECIKLFSEYGLRFDDDALLTVLSDNSDRLHTLLESDAGLINKRYTLRCAYTPCHEVSLLHLCAEFNHVDSARILVAHGADINAGAGYDPNGFGGQTPIFHTVNQNGHRSSDMLEYLLEMGADLSITVPGLVWGKGYEWETLIPSVNPISYAMMGLLPQMHRNERTINAVVSRLIKAAYDIDYQNENVPNRYLENH